MERESQTKQGVAVSAQQREGHVSGRNGKLSCLWRAENLGPQPRAFLFHLAADVQGEREAEQKGSDCPDLGLCGTPVSVDFVPQGELGPPSSPAQVIRYLHMAAGRVREGPGTVLDITPLPTSLP